MQSEDAQHGALPRAPRIGGWAGGLLTRVLTRLGRASAAPRRLTIVDRISLAPRQSIALIEADGRRFLVATAAEGAPRLFPVDPAPSLPAGQDRASANRHASLSRAALRTLPRPRRSFALARAAAAPLGRRAQW